MHQLHQAPLNKHSYFLATQVTVAFILISLSLALTGCGFKLRGYNSTSNPHSLTEVNLDCPTSKSWQLCQQIRQQLEQNHIKLSDKAEYKLVVSPVKQRKRVLSLQSNASAAEYGLTSQVSYQLLQSSDQEVFISQEISLDHSYRHESSALLAKEREREELQTTLSRQLALEICRQIGLFDTAQFSENYIEDSQKELQKNDQDESKLDGET